MQATLLNLELTDSDPLTIVKVAVPGPFLFPLDYCVVDTDDPEALKPVVGGRVKVPFINKTVVGLVLEITNQADYDSKKIKPIKEVLDTQALYSNTQLKLLTWAAQYYHEPIGEVVMTALPKRLRMGEPAKIKGLQYWGLTELGLSKTLEDFPKNAIRQQSLFQQFDGAQLKSESTLNETLENWRSTAKKLVEKGWLKTEFGPCLQTDCFPTAPNHHLNAEQQNAVDAVIETQQTQQQYAGFVLEGVTGSGKTEVYLGLIQQVLAKGQQALVLVPEIGLTPQMVKRFEAFLQTKVASMHSGLNDSERHCAWHLVQSGEIKVLLGTRSAVFAPFKDLGICIIDEEHDLSYKQQDGFRYSARDLIVKRAFMEKVPVVLGSATPSLETTHNINVGRYQHLCLSHRAGAAKPPTLKLLDIRGEKIQEGVSTPLKTAMKSHLENGGQVLLFLNRRGFAPVLMCHDCGWQAACPSCDANMTFHKVADPFDAEAGYLLCHHCGEQQAKPSVCPSCEGTEFVKVGQGTERLEQSIKEWFDEKTVLRIDRDTTRLKGSMAELTAKAESGEADILIGTQMLAKGHHFPNVTLVAILDIDQGLFSADFRASERMAQLILQVAGRAGRGRKKGEVLIQTHHPDHPLLTTLVKEGYPAFTQTALTERQKASLPPFIHQVLFRAEAVNAFDATQFLESLKSGLEAYWNQWQETDLVRGDIQLWGPVSAPMLRRQGRYRFQLLLQTHDRKGLHKLLAEMQPHIQKSPLSRKVRWSIDVDPQEMY